MKNLIAVLVLAVAVWSCGGSETKTATEESSASKPSDLMANGNPSYDPNRGEGKFTEVTVSDKLDVNMAGSGEKTFGVKCSSCHKLTDERLVGPGWSGVTKRYTAPWILNFMTNTDAMLSKDPKAQAQLEICLVRMPNQNLSDDEARSLYEFMRKNDGVK